MFQPCVGMIPNVKQTNTAAAEKSTTEVEAGALYIE